MSQRFTLDRKSFEQFLAAASLVQQFRRQAAYQHIITTSGQPLLSLVQLQQAINSGSMDLDAAISGVVALALSILGASSTGVWLFRSADDFCCYQSAGTIYDPERLGLDILGYLARTDRADSDSLPFFRSLRKASRYPGYPNSVAIMALRIEGNVVGALAAFSMDFEAFSRRDLDNLQFLAGLLEQAIDKALRSGSREAVALGSSALRQLLEHLLPRLEQLESQARKGPGIAEQGAGPAQYCPFPTDKGMEPNSGPSSLEDSEEVIFSDDGRSEDISLPGVGVRAALGDVREYTGDSQPFFLWTALRNVAAGAAKVPARVYSTIVLAIATVCAFVRSCAVRASRIPGYLLRPAARAFSVVPRTVSTWRPRLRAAAPSVWFRSLRSRTVTLRFTGLPRLSRPKLPKFEFSWLHSSTERFQELGTSCSTYYGRARNQIGAQYGYFVRVGRIRARLLRRDLRQLRADVASVPPQARFKMRVSARRQKNVLVSSAVVAGDALHRTGGSLPKVAAYLGRSMMAALAQAKILVFRIGQARMNGRGLRRSAGAVIVLAIMALFLSLQVVVHSSLRAGTMSASIPGTVVSALSSSHLNLDKTTAAPPGNPGPTSHLEITDSAVADSLHDLTKYEIATLRRAAEYGDDDAAFQLGMAYETGYYVQQSCSKAAHWVQVAAEAGNPAAAYNLGLRYRTGDGMSADEAAAAHWLAVASAHKYSPKLALTAER